MIFYWFLLKSCGCGQQTCEGKGVAMALCGCHSLRPDYCFWAFEKNATKHISGFFASFFCYESHIIKVYQKNKILNYIKRLLK